MNIRLGRRVFNYLLKHPEEHDQHFFFAETGCGTTRCIAGTAIMLMGIHYVPMAWGVIDPATRRYRDVAAVATELLDIDPADADQLFYCLDNEQALQRLSRMIQREERRRISQ